MNYTTGFFSAEIICLKREMENLRKKLEDNHEEEKHKLEKGRLVFAFQLLLVCSVVFLSTVYS